MGTYLLITPKEDELYHYGVKGMKWHQHKGFGSSSGAATTGMGGGSVEISEEEREIQRNELVSENLDRLASAMERSGRNVFHALVIRRGSAEAKRRAEAGKRKVQQIKEYIKKTGASFQQSDDQDSLTFALDYTPDDLMHFGIKGMKWGIRRFQPYQKGEHVKGGKEVGAATKVKQRPSSGNIIERYKAHKTKQKRVAALKKAQATRKANADFEAEKKKAIESGSVEDLAKFKGKLTNEEYSRAFMRLQNEKKVADMVAANQKTVWDKIDKGMAIVQKVGGYANTIATAKENFTKLDDAFHKKEKDAAKDAKEAAKNDFMNKATYEELVRDSSKHNLTTKEYSTVLARLTLEKKTKSELGIKDPDPAAEKAKKEAEAAEAKAKKEADKKAKAEEYEKRKELNAHSREGAKNLRNGLYKTPPPASSSDDDTYMRNVREWVESRMASEATPTPSLGTGSGSGSGSTAHTSSSNSAMNSARATSASAYARNAANASYNAKGAKVVKDASDSSPSPKSVKTGKDIAKKYYETKAYAATLSRVKSTYSNEGAKSAYEATKAKFAKEKADKEAADRAMIQRVLSKSRQENSSSVAKRPISGAKSVDSNTTYKQQTNLDFGGSNVSKFSAKPSTPSKVVTDTRQTVANTQAEAARQRELDKKRKAKMK